jgi:poly(A) polymerase
MLDAKTALANLERTTQSALFVLLGRIFSEAAHELSLVGGPVRDAFLGRKALDLDFTTSANPDETLEILKPHVDVHWDIGRAFGTIGARIGDETVEITTYRADKYDRESRNPQVSFGKSLEDDLFRRDFSVNSMALRLTGPKGTPIPAGELAVVDPYKGLQDLLDGVIRTPGAPEDSFSDDPLRMLRAARFASQLGFEIEPATFEAISAMSSRIEIIAAERIQVELTKLMIGKNPRAGIEVLVQTGLAALILPEIPALKLETDEHHHHKDVYEHTLRVVDQAIDYEKDYNLEGDFVLRFAALMHDIGKPATRKLEPGGAVSFYHHDMVGSKLAVKRMRALKFDNDTIKAVALLVELHLRFFGYSDQAWTDSAIRRYVRDAGEQLLRLHALTRADVTTRNQKKADRLSHAYDDLEKRIGVIMEQEELNALRPDLSGEDIMRILDLKPSPEVGQAYNFLMELRLEEGELGPEEAERRLLDWWRAR